MKNISIPWTILLAAAVALLALFVWMRVAASPDNQVSYPHARLTIQRSDGPSFSFDVEVATTPEQHEHGLMFRRSLPQDSGMLFLFKPDEVANFWMKNTYIPLDMLFVRGDGVIAKIATHTEPFDTTAISSGEPVRAVIEINAGESDRRGIHVGDKVAYSAFATGN